MLAQISLFEKSIKDSKSTPAVSPEIISAEFRKNKAVVVALKSSANCLLVQNETLETSRYQKTGSIPNVRYTLLSLVQDTRYSLLSPVQDSKV